MTATQVVALVAAAFGGGLMNAMAGGGTILVFPTLLLIGEPSIVANATSTVALLPGTAASLIGYRREVATHLSWLRTLLLPSLVGGALGSVLLLRTPEKSFARLAPLLVLFATLLFLLQGFLARRSGRARSGPASEAREARGEAGPADESAAGDGARHPPAGRWAAAALLQLAIAIYGGYFGAAVGILMLAVLGFMGLSNIHAMNGLKNFFGFCINGVAAAYFIFHGAVVWPIALVLMAGSISGGYGGALFAQRIGKEKARAAVVVIGFLVTALLFWQNARR